MSPTPPQDDLTRDWQTLVQTELAAIAGDRELRETWQATLMLWANAARAFAPLLPPAHDPPGSAPAAVAPGFGQPADDVIAALHARIAALERRLGDLESAARRPAG